MQAFDQTYADAEFQQRIESARSGWMDRIPGEQEPDLGVDGFRANLLTRLFGLFSRD